MPFWAWSWVMAAVSLTSLWLTGSSSKWGGRIGLLSQCGWLLYALDTHQIGFVLTVPAYSFVHYRNLRRAAATDTSL